MTPIQFDATLIQIKDWTIIHLPESISQELPSRGMVMIEADLCNTTIKVPLEPDGLGSHWFRLMPDLMNQTGLHTGDSITLSIRSTDEWSEPETPEDLEDALQSSDLEKTWQAITRKARWEWIRWIRATQNPETRTKRIQTACSMLAAGKKRPCCFNHSLCTETYVSKSGILLTDAADQ